MFLVEGIGRSARALKHLVVRAAVSPTYCSGLNPQQGVRGREREPPAPRSRIGSIMQCSMRRIIDGVLSSADLAALAAISKDPPRKA
jgi:hypothetical protein